LRSEVFRGMEADDRWGDGALGFSAPPRHRSPTNSPLLSFLSFRGMFSHPPFLHVFFLVWQKKSVSISFHIRKGFSFLEIGRWSVSSPQKVRRLLTCLGVAYTNELISLEGTLIQRISPLKVETNSCRARELCFRGAENVPLFVVSSNENFPIHCNF
jgi:hypothetical protein